MSDNEAKKVIDPDGNRGDEDGDEKRQAQVLPLDWTQIGTGEPSPAERLRYPSDVAEIDPSDAEIIIVGTAGQKITQMGPDLSATVNPDLQQLVLRSHLIRKMEGLSGFTKLSLLELYDNQIEALEDLETPGQTLTTLDMSYNVIRDMVPVQLCPHLTELYLANNKLKTMDGLKELKSLKKLDLGANRIRRMDPEQLAGFESLEELWLGKNKIECIEGLETLTKLRRLDVQSNRLTAISGLETQADTLEELFLAHNGIDSDGAEYLKTLEFPNLTVLDLSRNRLTHTHMMGHLISLDELWLSGNAIDDFDSLSELSKLFSLDTIYLEYNPVQTNEPLYRKKLVELVPNLNQIDANLIAPQVVRTVTAAALTQAQQGQSLQQQVFERALRQQQRQE